MAKYEFVPKWQNGNKTSRQLIQTTNDNNVSNLIPDFLKTSQNLAYKDPDFQPLSLFSSADRQSKYRSVKLNTCKLDTIEPKGTGSVFRQEFPLLDENQCRNEAVLNKNLNSSSVWNGKSKILSSLNNKVQVNFRSKKIQPFLNGDSKSNLNNEFKLGLCKNKSLNFFDKSSNQNESVNISTPVLNCSRDKLSMDLDSKLDLTNPKSSFTLNESNSIDIKTFTQQTSKRELLNDSHCNVNDRDISSSFDSLNMSNYTNSDDSNTQLSLDYLDVDVNCNGSYSTQLSKSLEDEHRFMKELGWQENNDDPSYEPLTEEEVNEFKNLLNSRYGGTIKKCSNISIY